ncbi:hypothetical protein C8R43DRAFT_963134 [Mycena crocata]|nr:hypothetical protein C8R43DRAFT_963134 [Mycena crocata]
MPHSAGVCTDHITSDMKVLLVSVTQSFNFNSTVGGFVWQYVPEVSVAKIHAALGHHITKKSLYGSTEPGAALQEHIARAAKAPWQANTGKALQTYRRIQRQIHSDIPAMGDIDWTTIAGYLGPFVLDDRDLWGFILRQEGVNATWSYFSNLKAAIEKELAVTDIQAQLDTAKFTHIQPKGPIWLGQYACVVELAATLLYGGMNPNPYHLVPFQFKGNIFGPEYRAWFLTRKDGIEISCSVRVYGKMEQAHQHAIAPNPDAQSRGGLKESKTLKDQRKEHKDFGAKFRNVIPELRNPYWEPLNECNHGNLSTVNAILNSLHQLRPMWCLDPGQEW